MLQYTVSNKWINAVIESREPPGSKRLLLLVLANRANDEGKCWPSIAKLQQDCGYESRRGMEKVCKGLIEWSKRAPAGSVIVSVEKGGGRSGTNVYHLSIAGGSIPEPPDDPEQADGVGAEQTDGSTPNSCSDEPTENPKKNPKQQTASIRKRNGTNPRLASVSVAQSYRGGGREALTTLLSECGVGSPKREELVEKYSDGIPSYVDIYKAKKKSGQEIGPGWLVQAIEEGWEFGPGPEDDILLDHEETLGVLERLGGSAVRPMHVIFNTVRTPTGTMWSPRPQWLDSVKKELLQVRRARN